MNRFWLVGMWLMAAPLWSAELTLEVPAAGAYRAVTVELAVSESERAQGLQGRTGLAPDHGMLFDFGHPQPVSMWMKQTLISLDMLFINDSGRIIGVRELAEPHSLELIHSPQPVRWVLELAGGSVARIGIDRGQLIRGLPD